MALLSRALRLSRPAREACLAMSKVHSVISNIQTIYQAGDSATFEREGFRYANCRSGKRFSQAILPPGRDYSGAEGALGRQAREPGCARPAAFPGRGRVPSPGTADRGL